MGEDPVLSWSIFAILLAAFIFYMVILSVPPLDAVICPGESGDAILAACVAEVDRMAAFVNWVWLGLLVTLIAAAVCEFCRAWAGSFLLIAGVAVASTAFRLWA